MLDYVTVYGVLFMRVSNIIYCRGRRVEAGQVAKAILYGLQGDICISTCGQNLT